jgi:hypothetical protein
MGWTSAQSEKDDKRLAHRSERAMVRDALAHEREPGRVPRSAGWDFAKDGKQRFDPREHPDWMRK